VLSAATSSTACTSRHDQKQQQSVSQQWSYSCAIFSSYTGTWHAVAQPTQLVLSIVACLVPCRASTILKPYDSAQTDPTRMLSAKCLAALHGKIPHCSSTAGPSLHAPIPTEAVAAAAAAAAALT
jgi:hypothetical protein